MVFAMLPVFPSAVMENVYSCYVVVSLCYPFLGWVADVSKLKFKL